jgi:hypothetical protein
MPHHALLFVLSIGLESYNLCPNLILS